MTMLFAMSKNDLVEWTLYVVIVIFIVAIAIALLTAGTSWISPRVERLQKGLKPQPGEKPCCPPGVGCNDPNPGFRACRRDKAIQFATMENDIAGAGEMEAAWTEFHGLPKWRTSARKKALAKYSGIRDRIFFKMVSKNMDGPVNSVPQLSAAMTPDVEEAEAEIVDDSNSGKKKSPSRW